MPNFIHYKDSLLGSNQPHGHISINYKKVVIQLFKIKGILLSMRKLDTDKN